MENAAGDPVANLPVNLSRITRTIGGALLSSGPGPSTRSRGDGTFAIGNVPPGEYVLNASLSSTESASHTVMIAESDLTGLVLRPRADSP